MYLSLDARCCIALLYWVSCLVHLGPNLARSSSIISGGTLRTCVIAQVLGGNSGWTELFSQWLFLSASSSRCRQKPGHIMCLHMCSCTINIFCLSAAMVRSRCTPIVYRWWCYIYIYIYILGIKRKYTNYFFQSIKNNTKHKLMQMLYFESIIIWR